MNELTKRILKFRCWENSENRMILWDDIYKHIERTGGAVWFYFSNEDQEMIMMQFTGIIDKNGKEIYEGDIIQYTQHYFNTEMINTKIKVVKWNMDRWNIFSTNAGETDIEVIGNIYENPEKYLDILI